MAKKTLEQRLRAVEDRNEILLLMGAYLNAADGGWTKKSHDGKAVAKLFVKDGVWETKNFIRAVGPAKIKTAFDAMQKHVPIACHITANPMLKVSGDKASGEWHVMVMHSNRAGHDMFTIAKYYNEFVRTPKGWRFKQLLAIPFLDGPYRDGWTRMVNNLKTGKLLAKLK